MYYKGNRHIFYVKQKQTKCHQHIHFKHYLYVVSLLYKFITIRYICVYYYYTYFLIYIHNTYINAKKHKEKISWKLTKYSSTPTILSFFCQVFCVMFTRRKHINLKHVLIYGIHVCKCCFINGLYVIRNIIYSK